MITSYATKYLNILGFWSSWSQEDVKYGHEERGKDEDRDWGGGDRDCGGGGDGGGGWGDWFEGVGDGGGGGGGDCEGGD